MLCFKLFQNKEWLKNHRTGYHTIIFFRGRTINVAPDDSSDDSLSDDDCEKIVLKRKRLQYTYSDDSVQIIPVSADVLPDRLKSSYRGESVVNDRSNWHPYQNKEGRLNIFPKICVTLRPTCKSELCPYFYSIY